MDFHEVSLDANFHLKKIWRITPQSRGLKILPWFLGKNTYPSCKQTSRVFEFLHYALRYVFDGLQSICQFQPWENTKVKMLPPPGPSCTAEPVWHNGKNPFGRQHDIRLVGETLLLFPNIHRLETDMNPPGGH